MLLTAAKFYKSKLYICNNNNRGRSRLIKEFFPLMQLGGF